MRTLNAASWRAAILGRWTARIVGTLMALFFLAFVVGEGPPPVFSLSWHQNLQLIGLTGLFLGLLLTWRWEGWGGLVALSGFGLLLAVDWRFNASLLFLAPAATGLLSLLCWWRIAAGPPPSAVAWQVPRTALGITGALVALFILLCANEIFGQPPLMTPPLRPSPELVGTWQGALPQPPPLQVEFRIAGDGEVSGRIGDTPFTGGRIRNNRSWFGNLMHWREPYEIRSAGFTAGVSIRGREMRAFLVFAGGPRGWGLKLRKL